MHKYYSSLRFLYDKTPKRPNAQTPKRLLAVLLCLLVLYGCKRQLLDPLNPQNNLPEKVKLDKVKGFYENGRYKNQPKRTSGNERMTAADSARFKDFEPQWDKTVVELLSNNEKMLIVPVLRNLQVNYNKSIGFIRRLCIRVDANEDFIEANIVELVGNLTFVKENHNAIFKDYKENNISGFSGVMATYDLSYNRVITEKFENGVSNGQNAPQDLILVGSGGCIIVYSDAGVVVYDGCSNGGVGNGGTGGGLGGTGTGSGGTGSGGTGGSGTGISGTGGTGNNPTYACRCPGGSHCYGSGACNSLGIPATLPGYTPPTSPPVITPPYVYVPPTQGNPYPTNTYPGTNPNTGTGGGGYDNGEAAPVPLPKTYPSQTPTPPNTPRPPTSTTPRPPTVQIPVQPYPNMFLGDDLVWYFLDGSLPDDGQSWGSDWGDGIPRDENGLTFEEYMANKLKVANFQKIFRTASHRRNPVLELKYAKILDSMRTSNPIADSIYKKIVANLISRSTPGISVRVDIEYKTPLLNPVWAENYGNTDIDARGIPFVQLGEKAGPEVFFEELTHVLQFLERRNVVRPDYTELVHMEMEAKIINHLIFGFRGGTALFRRSKNGLLNYEDSYEEWIANIKLENLSNFGAGQFCWTNFEKYIEYFATFPDPGYNYLQDLNFVPTRLPTILFLLFR